MNGNDLTLTTFQTFYLSHNNVLCINDFILSTPQFPVLSHTFLGTITENNMSDFSQLWKQLFLLYILRTKQEKGCRLDPLRYSGM